MKKKKAKADATIQAWAEKNALEIEQLLAIGRNRFHLTGTQLFPVPVGDHVIHTPLPVSADLRMDKEGGVAAADVQADETALSAARAFLHQLIEENNLSGLPGLHLPGATHTVENKGGKWVLKRRRFY